MVPLPENLSEKPEAQDMFRFRKGFVAEIGQILV
jgi:hypothetical protein